MNIEPGPRDMEILLYGGEGLHKVTLLRTHRFLSLCIPDLNVSVPGIVGVTIKVTSFIGVERNDS